MTTFTEDDLARPLDALRQLDFRLFAPLFHDTFPLAYFYALALHDKDHDAGDMVRIVDWNKPLEMAHQFEQVAGKPFAVYMPRSQYEAAQDDIEAGIYESYFVPVSEFLLGHVYAQFESSAIGDTLASIKTYSRDTPDDVSIRIISDSANLAIVFKREVIHRWMFDGIDAGRMPVVTISDPTKAFSDRSYRPHSMTFLCFSATAQQAIRKAGVDLTQLDVDHNLFQDVKELTLGLVHFFPRSVDTKGRAMAIHATTEFHSRLFGLRDDAVNTTLTGSWRRFMELKLSEWPVPNLFASPTEFFQCIQRNHLPLG